MDVINLIMHKEIPFCDMNCCFSPGQCTDSGEISINNSNYHKICKIHLLKLSCSSISCGYCSSKIKVISSSIQEALSKLKSKTISFQISSKISTFPSPISTKPPPELNHLEAPSTNYQILENLPKTSSKNQLLPKIERISNEIFLSNLKTFKSSEDDLNQNIFTKNDDFKVTLPEENRRKVLNYSEKVKNCDFEDFSNTRRVSENSLGCLIQVEYCNYSLKNDIILWKEVFRNKGECFNCGLEIYGLTGNSFEEDPQMRCFNDALKRNRIILKTEKISEKCDSCHENAQDLAIFPCFHSACLKCLKTGCKTCNPGGVRSLCTSCNEMKILCISSMKQQKYPEASSLRMCFDCLEVKVLSYPPVQSQKFLSENRETPPCSRKASLSSLNSSEVTQNDEKKNILEARALPCGHSVCSNCFKLKPPCFLCMTHSSFKTICEVHKVTSLSGHCKKCKILLCSLCDKNHFPNENRCDHCLSKKMNHYSNCKENICRNHQFCINCHPSLELACMICYPISSECPTCLDLNHQKMIFKCEHIGCARCFKNFYCFECIFIQNKRIPRLDISKKCSFCKKTKYEGIFTLICNHNICDGCIKKKKTLKLQSYFCLKCILKKTTSVVSNVSTF